MRLERGVRGLDICARVNASKNACTIVVFVTKLTSGYPGHPRPWVSPPPPSFRCNIFCSVNSGIFACVLRVTATGVVSRVDARIGSRAVTVQELRIHPNAPSKRMVLSFLTNAHIYPQRNKLTCKHAPSFSCFLGVNSSDHALEAQLPDLAHE